MRASLSNMLSERAIGKHISNLHVSLLDRVIGHPIILLFLIIITNGWNTSFAGSHNPLLSSFSRESAEIQPDSPSSSPGATTAWSQGWKIDD